MKTKLITPNGIRVWQGYRSQQYQGNTQGFLEKLGQIFIPITMQLMSPMGLRMYYPALVPQAPDCRQIRLPDEIALVGYPSQQMYFDASRHTVAGRAYSSLHETVFNFSAGTTPASFSDFPIAYPGASEFQWKIPYYFSGEAIDWHGLYVGVLIWMWPDDALDNKTQVATALLDLCNQRITGNRNLFEIIAVLQEDYGILWFASDALSWPDSIIHFLGDRQCNIAMQAFHDIANISPLFSEDDDGLKVSVGQALDVRLST
ncbi:hypothetical protein GCE9029_02610 [Grimontia celer]|uniref:Uncharacterized protein n=1 Tax=Grimontia celer TaxID=1796497 RepID=A0A128F3V3_9GAMM|nr:hypothetical protein [Grimontia celer]CZF81439.1 hypothetical protein GCE9029_02610 [Grimontia celer]